MLNLSELGGNTLLTTAIVTVILGLFMTVIGLLGSVGLVDKVKDRRALILMVIGVILIFMSSYLAQQI